MLVIGIDAASQLTKCGFAIGEWSGDQVQIRIAGYLEEKAQPDALRAIILPMLNCSDRALIAIDAPLGWPAALGSSLADHSAGAVITSNKDELFSRHTDRFIHALLKKKPLEVGADKIARAAHSALSILDTIRAESNQPVPLAWNPEVERTSAIEVYPAATLIAHGLSDKGKKDNKDDRQQMILARRVIVSSLAARITNLAEYIEAKDDVFDACLCLVAAADFLAGDAIAPDRMEVAQREGWVWVKDPRSRRPVVGGFGA